MISRLRILAVTLAVLLAWAVPSRAAIALVASVSAGAVDSTEWTVTTAAIDTTGATFLVMGCSWYNGNGTPDGLTDSKSNTWTPLTARAGGAASNQLFYAENPTVGTGHTFTCDLSTFFLIYPALTVLAFSGTATSTVFDLETGAGSAAATSLQPGSLTPSADNEVLVIGFTALDPAITSLVINGGFTKQEEVVRTDDHKGGSIAYLIQTTAAAANPTWSWTTAVDSAAGMASFKEAGGAPSGPPAGSRALLGVGP